MQSEESIYSELRKYVSDLVDGGAVTRIDWIAQAFLSSRNDISGADAGFYRGCAHAHIHRIAKKVVGKYDIEARSSQDAQIVLEGFEHLQRAYTVPRDGFTSLVPIHKMNDDELLARAAEYEQMAVGCRRHAREIRDFVNARGQSEAAA